MQFHYPHIPNNLLLDLLQDSEFAEALVHLAARNQYSQLEVIPQDFSIEISNNEICVMVILYSGFEQNEWLSVKDHPNLHLICFSEIITQMHEFEGMNIIYIDKLSWFLNIINGSKSDKIKALRRLKDLSIS